MFRRKGLSLRHRKTLATPRNTADRYPWAEGRCVPPPATGLSAADDVVFKRPLPAVGAPLELFERLDVTERGTSGRRGGQATHALASPRAPKRFAR